MLRFIVRKLAHVVPVLFLVSLATMLMVDLSPGDPAYAILGDNATPEQVALVNDELGLDDPLLVRWANWASDTMRGDLGTSVRTGQSVSDALRERVPATLELTVLALLIGLLVAIPMGIYAAYRADRWFDRASGLVTSLLISSPAFLTAVLLSYFLAVKFQIFPVSGWVSLSDSVSENLKSAFLPALTLALGEIAVFSRLLRADMIATLQDPFILTARAKGMPDRYILLRHAFRPSSFSLLTLSGLSLGRLIGGAVIVENMFAIPGVGSLLVQAIIAGDLVMVQGVVLFIAVVYVVVNTIVDLSYGLLDPRVRRGACDVVRADERLNPLGTSLEALPEAKPSMLDPIGRAVARPPKQRGRWLFWLAAGWLILVSALAILADVLPLEPYDTPIGPPLERPGWRWSQPLGTDQLGRSMTSRLIFGARVSLSVGVAAMVLGAVVGGLLGLVAGYFRRASDSVIGVLMDTMLAFPPLVLLLAITTVMTQSFRTLIIGLGVVAIPAFARLSRANTLPFAQREFVVAARSMGARHGRILFREILPNVLFPVGSYAFIVLAAIIVGEGSLSFLGLGIPPPQPSWGGMIASGRNFLATDPYLVFLPAMALLLTVFSFNIIGDRARRRFDVRESMLA